ncbi:rRNA maturation RNase YbeY [Olivibacter sitiensis]|uniref:rRNA maturation RNase YbeY n=1 Tax=Olivibacter sitiensis TaxID=376470 RepID=UPI0004002DC6|nr:rRNA maturation RNase YbeY [Olivibacter sitiensis]
MANIQFYSEEISFVLKQKEKTRQWIKAAIKEEGFRAGHINFIFCNDEYLHKINVQYLDHDTYTDIVTFDNSEDEERIDGDLFISVERTNENAKQLGISETDELHRVMIHGIMHLCGYLDKKPADKSKMTERENYYLDKRIF